MRVLILFFVLVSNIFAANLLSMSVNENSDAVEINLSFDSQFEGYIEQNGSGNTVILKISGIALDSKKEVELSQNSLISKITMIKDGTSAATLAFATKKEVAFEALKNNDGYKLQLKLTPQAATAQKNDTNATTTPMPKAQTTDTPKPQADDEISWRYVVVVSFLAFLVAIMFYIKKRVANGGIKGGWLLPKSFKPEVKQEEVQVVTQSFLDPNNKLMLVEYSGVKYLLLVGNTNLVIDRYYADDADIQPDDFKKIMLENERKLTEFLKPQQQLSNFDEYRIKAEGNL